MMIVLAIGLLLCIGGIIAILIKSFEDKYNDEDNNHWTGIK